MHCNNQLPQDQCSPQTNLDLGSAYRLAPQSLVSKPLRGSFGGITIDIQTREETKTNKTTIYMKSGHMTSVCVTVRDSVCVSSHVAENLKRDMVFRISKTATP